MLALNEKYKQPLNVSFFMPAYNCEKTIRESVESIIESNFTEGDELVIVNDFSTDNTEQILNQLKEKYPCIKVLKHTRNKGGAAARNTAIENSKHSILFCLDSDNVLSSGSICKLKEFMKNVDADVASFQELRYFQDDKQKIDFKWVFKPDLITVNDCLSSVVVPGASGNYMFTKESWIRAGGYPEFAGALDTWGFGLRQLMTGAKVYTMPNTFYYHRYGHESYWMRDAEKRKKSVSLRATQLLIPFFDLIDEKDINYIMSRKGRYTWFDNLDKRPIRLASKENKKLVWSLDKQQGFSLFVWNKEIFNRLKFFIKQLFLRWKLKL